MHSSPTPAPPVPGGSIERLIQAERDWRAQLDAAHAEAERLITAARAESERADRAFEADLHAALDRRRRELEDDLAAALARVEERARADLGAFRDLPDDEVRRLAVRVAREVPWLASSVLVEEERS